MSDSEHKQALPAGYELEGYRLVRVLGVGGFGVTYLAEDVRLGRPAAVKEYLPNEFAIRAGETVHPKSRNDQEDFEWGLRRFLEEARTLARFRHPNLVRVLDYFEMNHTAYIVMEYEEGESLDRILERQETLSEAQLKRLLLPIVDGLKEVHAAGYLHRDIKPSNVFIRRSDESPVLLDFGSARQALGRKSKSLTAVASAGYSPPEQYESEGEQGPWTDIYSLSALCYRAMTGTVPIEAPRRMNRLAQRQPDPLPKLAKAHPEGYSRPLLSAVDRGLEPIPVDRPVSLDEWMGRLALVRPGARAPRTSIGRESDTGSRPQVHVGEAAAVLRELWSDVRAAASDLLPRQLRSNVGAALATVSPRVWLVVGAAVVVVATALLLWTPQHGTLTLELMPRDATVTLSDPTLPYRPGIQLPNGLHVVTVRRPGYQEVTRMVQVSGDTRERIQLARAQPRGRLTLDLVPPDATVTLGDSRLPYRPGIPLPGGQHEVTIRRTGYREVTRLVFVSGDTRIRIELERMEPRGRLTLDLAPPDATVSLDDSRTSYRPGIRLPNGRHAVTVARPGYRPATQTVLVSGDTRVRIELEMVEPRGPAGMEFVWIPPGAFRLGSASSNADGDERPLTQVRISQGFWLGKHEVTQREWEAVMDSNPSHFSGCRGCPVEQVSWGDVQEFVSRLNEQEGRQVYRLPTEAEWEYAARAGSTRDRDGELDTIAWYFDNSGARTSQVGQKRPNAWGLYDVLGNVWEWVGDRHGPYPGGTVTDPRGPRSGAKFVLRGAGWASGASSARVSNRLDVGPNDRRNYHGFRVLRTP